MNKTVFKISKMDCPSEEQVIRMKLSEVSDIDQLEFDIANRYLTVYHKEAKEPIFKVLDSLNFDTTIKESITVHNYEKNNNHQFDETKLLWQVLLINFFFFLLEIGTGFFANSMGLVADSFDMLADSIVYGLSLFVVGNSVAKKKSIAKVAGYFQLVLAGLGFVEVIKRFLSSATMPLFQTMIIISLLALLGNALCLYLLQKSKSQEAHMQASMIFTSNDVIVNLGVIIAGVLVYVTQSKFPDLIIGSIVFILVTKGAFKILKLAQ